MKLLAVLSDILSDICKSSSLEEGEKDEENASKDPHLGEVKFTELRAVSSKKLYQIEHQLKKLEQRQL